MLRNLLTALSVFSLLIFANAAQVFAHGGEETAAPKAVTNQAGTVVRVARAGELEIMLKHQAIEPDTAQTAQVFITKFATNEPFADAKPSIEITAPDGKTFEASEAKSDAPGSFSFKLPPLPQGNYTILARVNAAGKTDTATFSNVAVAHPASDSAESSATGSWLRTIAMVLTAIVILGLFAGLVFFAPRFFKRDEDERETVSKEAVSV